MNNLKTYIEILDEIEPEEELIKQTINRIRKIDAQKKNNNLEDKIKKIIITAVSVSACTGGAFAAAKILNLDDKFVEYFNLKHGELEQMGVKICKVGETVEENNVKVTLEQFIADKNNIYVILQIEGIEQEQIAKYQFSKGKTFQESNLLGGTVNVKKNTNLLNSCLINLAGVDELNSGEYITIRLDLDDNKHLDITTKIEKTVTEISKQVNYKIERENGDSAILKNIKISPLGMEVILDITDNKENNENGIKYGYSDFDRVLVLKNGNSIRLDNKNIELNYNDLIYTDEQIVEESESTDGKRYMFYYIPFGDLIKLDDISKLTLGNTPIDIEKLVAEGSDDEKYSDISTYKKDISDINQENTIKDNKMKEFLTNNQIISTMDFVGSGYIDLYYFTRDGKFSYYQGESLVIEEGQIISYRGEWLLEDGKLILKVLEEEKASGGRIVEADELFEKHLEDYEEVVSQVNYTKLYNAKKAKFDSREYIALDEVNLYQISIDENMENIVKTLATKGYAEYKQLKQ